MRPFNRSDLGRLYIGRHVGPRALTYIGDASIDALASASTVTHNGNSYSVSSLGRQWTGSLTARSGELLLAYSRDWEKLDLVVLYGDDGCRTGEEGENGIALIEGAVISGESYSAPTSLSSAARAPVAASCTFMAEKVSRLRTGNTRRRRAVVTGTIVALAQADGTTYAIACAPANPSVNFYLIWSDDLVNWDGTLCWTAASPTYLGICSLRIMGDYAYFGTGADLLRLAIPRPGVTYTAQQAARVRLSRTSAAPVCGLAESEGNLYALLSTGLLWRITPDGIVTAVPLVDADYKGMHEGPGGILYANSLDLGIAVRPGRSTIRYPWPGADLFWLGGSQDALVAITRAGIVLENVYNNAIWVERARLGGIPIAIAQASEGVIYAAVASGTHGTRLFVSVADRSSWRRIDADAADVVCLLPRNDGSVVVGGHNLVAGADRSAGAESITSCRVAGHIWTAGAPV